MNKSEHVRIASSNIRFENPADNENDWPLRRALWSEMVNEFAPYILGTQEGREPQLKDAQTLLPNLKLVDQHREWIEERMYPCLFVNEQLVNVLHSGDAWLSETPEVAGSKSFDSAFPRLCTWAKVQLIKERVNLFVINTHLDHVQAATRECQIKVLIETIKRENTSNDPVILMGDFNEDPFGSVRETLDRDLKLVDPWIKFCQEEETSHHKFCGVNERGARIDWILVDKSITPISIDLDKRNDGKTWPSDHFMVKAEFKL